MSGTTKTKSSDGNDPADGRTQPNDLDLAMGRRIRERRATLRVSQTALADAVGITFQQIQKYERGYNRVSFSRLVDIAHALDCRVADLIGELDGGKARPIFSSQTAYLRETGAPELLAAYAAIPKPMRKAVLKLVIEIAKGSPIVRRPAA